MAPQPSRTLPKNEIGTYLLLWSLVALYALARILQVWPGKVPMWGVVALHVFPPIVFALIHGTLIYRIRSILIFFAICFIVGNIFENLGVRAGFPFGRYYFTDVMGPKLSVVPIMLGLAYLGMAYLSWTLARLILGNLQSLERFRIVTLPVVASFVMVAWDLSMDPVWSTILHAWVWVRGGAYFGVPVSNFIGWFLTVYVIFQLFSFYLLRRSAAVNRLPARYWRMAVIFYGVSAAGNILIAIPQDRVATVYDATGVQWKVSDITLACALVSVLIMGTFAVVAWVRMRTGFE
ncbi:MAG TPA: carotenoid biosynthesis protein [Candidatus Acidoferrum sp.]|nr:carotenoid biosynthesis protein [Candidatus Acidoferrum sp.]